MAFFDLRPSQAEPSTVDFVRDDALMDRFSNSVIQALHEVRRRFHRRDARVW